MLNVPLLNVNLLNAVAPVNSTLLALSVFHPFSKSIGFSFSLSLFLSVSLFLSPSVNFQRISHELSLIAFKLVHSFIFLSIFVSFSFPISIAFFLSQLSFFLLSFISFFYFFHLSNFLSFLQNFFFLFSYLYDSHPPYLFLRLSLSKPLPLSFFCHYLSFLISSHENTNPFITTDRQTWNF